jgi:vacuolar-type H+-ATPase subunit H
MMSKKNIRHSNTGDSPDHLAAIHQIERAEADENRKINEARKKAEDKVLATQAKASLDIQNAREESRQNRRGMVKNEMESAEALANQELADADLRAGEYILKGTQFIHQAKDIALHLVIQGTQEGSDR